MAFTENIISSGVAEISLLEPVISHDVFAWACKRRSFFVGVCVNKCFVRKLSDVLRHSQPTHQDVR